MFIAHLPAGYLITCIIKKSTRTKGYMWLGLLASILPDLDLLYFYFVDNRNTNHHDYFMHLPIFWGLLLLYSVCGVHLFSYDKKRAYSVLAIFFTNIFVHMVMDSYVGYIRWFYPIFYYKVQLIDIPATHDWWVWNFVLHWSFLLELCIVALALIVVRKTHVRI